MRDDDLSALEHENWIGYLTGVVRCTGTIVHRGRTVVTTEAKAEDAEGRLLAHATSTILVLDS